MTTGRSGGDKNNGNSRFPSGMTSKKGNDTCNCTATATATAVGRESGGFQQAGCEFNRVF
jgi:hypothetical protein